MRGTVRASGRLTQFPAEGSACTARACDEAAMATRLFPALLKFWRAQRGLSQLDLSVEAGVTQRHLSFLESGRARPSEEMVLQLLSVLRVPLRGQNEALRAAGFQARFGEPALAELPAEVNAAIDQMFAAHEPFPMTVVAPDGAIVRSNRSAPRVFGAFLLEPAALRRPPDMVSMMFDPKLMRPFIVEWEAVAHGVVARLHRERLEHANDERYSAALERALSFPGVPETWRVPDFSKPVPPMMTVCLTRGALRVGFLITVTTFSAPQQVTLEELRLESGFPLDDETRRVCRRLVDQAPAW